MPWKSAPFPTGISTGTTLGERCAFTSSKTRSKLARSRSIWLTKMSRGRCSWSQISHTFSVPTSTPPVALSTTTAASAA